LVLCSILVSLFILLLLFYLCLFYLIGWMDHMFIVTFSGREYLKIKGMLYWVCDLWLGKSLNVPFRSSENLVLKSQKDFFIFFLFCCILEVDHVVHVIDDLLVILDEEVLVHDHLHLVVSFIVLLKFY
jgi:hypothetical protein